ncbi:VOC family protein [Streptomyces sp. NPDC020807]|uniref:VOC family protein n=1 Tax=Streptomyces sp. NPDC020807 TaxID=3155119 RepID=UPI0033CB1D1A
MRSRTGGMWWGTTIGAPDPGALAGFCAQLLDRPVVGPGDPDTEVVAASPKGPFPVFQRADGHRPPVWPAVAPGTTVAEYQPRENVRVLFDPAGHPFCLCRDDDE